MYDWIVGEESLQARGLGGRRGARRHDFDVEVYGVREWQDMSVVAHQNDRLTMRLIGHHLGSGRPRNDLRLGGVDIRVLEQTEIEHLGQKEAHRRIELRLSQQSLVHGIDHALRNLAFREEVGGGLHRLGIALRYGQRLHAPVRANTRRRIAHDARICIDVALETHVPAQQCGDQGLVERTAHLLELLCRRLPPVARKLHTTEFVGRNRVIRHYGACAGVHCGLKRHNVVRE